MAMWTLSWRSTSLTPFFFLFTLLAAARVSCAQREEGWIQPSHMPSAHAFFDAPSVSDLALFAGGSTRSLSGSYSDVVDIFNVTDLTWAPSTSLAGGARSYVAATSLGALAFFAGGRYPNGSASAAVDIYNVTSGVWTQAWLSDRRWGLAAAATSAGGGMALFGGGLSESSLTSAVLDIYHANNNSWTTALLSQARCYLAATSVADVVLFAGGVNEGGTSAQVDIYNASSNTWSSALLSQARSRLSATRVGDQALIGCGSIASNPSLRATGMFSVVDIYHASNNTWTTASLSQARHRCTATSLGDLAFFAGGLTNVTGTVSDSAVVDIYNTSSNSWHNGSLSLARNRMASTTVGTLALFAGGALGDGPTITNLVDIYGLTPMVPSSTPSPMPSSIPHTGVPTVQIDNSTGLDVVFIPKESDKTREDLSVRVSFGGAIREIDPTGLVMQQGFPLISNPWSRVIDDDFNATESYLFSARFSVNASSESNDAILEVQFYLFDSPTAIRLSDNISLHIEPAFAKFTIRLFRWPWRSENNTLEMRININPSFTDFTSAFQPHDGLTSFTLDGQFGNQAKTILRLVRTVELDGRTETGARFELSSNRSELILYFDHFNSSLVYDPDVGVLFGSASNSGGDSVPVLLIIGVSVGAVVVIVLVSIVLGTALLVLWMRKKRAQDIEEAKTSRINFVSDDNSILTRSLEDMIELRSSSGRPRSLPSHSPLALIYSKG